MFYYFYNKNTFIYLMFVKIIINYKYIIDISIKKIEIIPSYLDNLSELEEL